MFKKTVGIFTVAMAISVPCFADSPVTQDQWSNTSASQGGFVNTTGPARVTQYQNSTKNTLQTQAATAGGASQGQSASVTGVQVQAGKTSGPAQLAQFGNVRVSMGDEQVVKQKKQGQVTGINNSVSQTTATPEASLVMQAQVNHASASHFQLAIPSGPSIQTQNAHVNSGQFQAAITKPDITR
ncbi:hypothetical protein [Ectobacillus panaciterrae]|uniref:hypothetical protein n=1 Tax=Ectobacillus panaciterrae TaxID=363872 RepID=UPI000402CAC9|nr:hypothetical protein [Ectobacillus panaciterrae]